MLPVEQLTEQLQRERQERLKRLGQSDAPSELPSGPPSVTDDGSLQSSSYIHMSRLADNNFDLASSRPKKSKAQLWQDMKINSISRALTLLYVLPLLTLLTRIQLNLLGRRTYLSSVVALASPPAAAEESNGTISMENRDDDNYDNIYGADFETNRRYLTFSWWLLHKGSKQILERVMEVVKEVFGGVNIREDMTFDDLSKLISQARGKIEGSNEQEKRQMHWLQYLLPPKGEEMFVIRQGATSASEEFTPSGTDQSNASTKGAKVEDDAICPALRRLLDETADLVDSPTFSFVLTRLLDAAFSNFVEYRIATEAFGKPASQSPGVTGDKARVTEISDSKCKLAHILPVFCREAHSIVVGDDGLEALAEVAAQAGNPSNEYLAAIDRVQDLIGFAAVIYSSNFEFEVNDGEQPSRLGKSRVADHLDARGSPESVQIAADLQGGTESSPVGESTVVVPPVDTAVDKEEQREQPGGFDAVWSKAMPKESKEMSP